MARIPPADELQSIELHGHPVCYRKAGEGPALVLIHGITASSACWAPVMPALARNHTVIAPDLMGHGGSAKPMGDYSLGAFACVVRDLLLALGHERATIVGHSLGGGVAMQFSYQFPERVDRLALVSSGGLGREVHVMLRAATLPGADFVLPALARTGALGAGAAVGRWFERIGLHPNPDLQGIADGIATLGDEDACRAFLHTVRSILDLGGQRVNATDKLYLAAGVPVLIVWGRRDPLIPAAHAHAAHELMPHSRLEIFEAGHFPFEDEPMRFANVLESFVAETEPASLDSREVMAAAQEAAGEEEQVA
jgi:pimeloyl-ACP methyl ester carboxylesterase